MKRKVDEKKGSLWADLHEKDLNPLYGKRWCLYILPQYLANLTEPLAHIKSLILAKFITVRTKLCIYSLKFSDFFCFFFFFFL